MMEKLKLVNRRMFFLYFVPFAFFCLISLVAIHSFDFAPSITEQDSSYIKEQYQITVERQEAEQNIGQNSAQQSGASAANIAGSDYLSVIVRKGHSFSDTLAEAGIDRSEAQKINESIRRVINLKSLGAGQEILVAFGEDGSRRGSNFRLASLKISAPEHDIEVMRDDGGNFITRSTQKKLTQRPVKASFKIIGSLYQSGISAGISPNIMLEIIRAYSYDVDFQRDIKSGDDLTVLYGASFNPQGRKVHDGNVIYAALNTGGKELKIYRHIDKSGDVGYFTVDGQSVKKSLLRTPVNGAHITSRFGFRMHPLLGFSRMHQGIDFGAPAGTPIFASGSGVIEEMGPKGGYGKYMKVRHNSDYASAYAHISRFASGMRPGRKVKQGEIIAYVGSTGLATGPHLHYEIIFKGEKVNPLSVKSTPGVKLAGAELKTFRKETQALDSMLAALPQQGAAKVASGNLMIR